MIHDFVSIRVDNDPIGERVKISACSKATSFENLFTGDLVLKIIRYDDKSGDSEIKGSPISINTPSDFNFVMYDTDIDSGIDYMYSFILIEFIDSMEIIQDLIIQTIRPFFIGTLIGNEYKSYKAIANSKTEISRNKAVEYVTTLSSRFPYAVSNSNANYTSGKTSGLFLRISEDGSLSPDYDHSFAQEIIDFLTDGTPKILKLETGQRWYVSVDANPKEVYSNFLGAHEIEFSWTEIGEIPDIRLAGVIT